MFPLPVFTKDPVGLVALRVAEAMTPSFTTSPSVSNIEYAQIFPADRFKTFPLTERRRYEVPYP